MYIRRKVEKACNAWLRREQRKPLIVRGARQVGKSTFVRETIKQAGHNLVEVNVEEHQTFLKSAFESGTAKEILAACSRITGTDLNRKDARHVLFLDEIQALPSGLGALRYLQEHRSDLPIIAAGSVLEFTLTDKKISMPVGRVEYLYVTPMTFDEFLQGLGREDLVMIMQQVLPWDVSTLTLAQHAEFLDYLQYYFVVGGMPAAVSAFVSESMEARWDAAARVHRNLLTSYRDDIQKYPGTAHIRDIVREVFDRSAGVIGQKLKYVHLAPGEPARDVKKAINLLFHAGILQEVVHTDAHGIPLNAGEDPDTRKIYYLDQGVYLASLGLRLTDMKGWDVIKLVNQGALAEQVVAQSLLTRGDGEELLRSHYWLRERKAQNAEIDFVVAHGPHIIPIEVKSGKTGRLRSLSEYCATHSTEVALRFDMNVASVQRAAFASHKVTKNLRNPTLVSLPLYLVTEMHRIVQSWIEENPA
jgi:predicted AAA+ superfamily ATPase